MQEFLPSTTFIAITLLLAFTGFGIWSGFRRGPLRQVAGPAALATGITAGWLSGTDAGYHFLEGTGVPWILRGPAGFLGIALITTLFAYSFVRWIGRKPEGEKESEHRVAGAFLGFWTGVLYFTLLLLALFSWAAVTETLGGKGVEHHWAVRAKSELVKNGIGDEFKDWSPIPRRHRALVAQAKLILTNPDALRRLMNMPEIRALAANPTVYQAWQDKEFRKLLNEKDIEGILTNERTQAILSDEQLQKDISKLNLHRLVEKALEKPTK